MDDAAAFMELVRSNSQGELTPLKRGMHYRRSGLSVRDYAETVGRSKSAVQFEAQAARRCSLALVATLVGSLPRPAPANSHGLLVPSVPAASCTTEDGDGKWTHGAFVLGGRLPPEPGEQRPRDQWLRCPLPVDDAAVADQDPDDDITSFRVLYHDADGREAGTFVQVVLYQTTLLPSGALQSRPVCL
jgi:hypothetical protein